MKRQWLYCMTALIVFAMLGSETPQGAGNVPINTGDVNCDSSVNILDLTSIVDYIFRGGAGPCDFISPGIAYASRDDTISLVHDWDQGTFVNVASITMNVPADGIVLVNCTADVLTSGYLALGTTTTNGNLLRVYGDDGGTPFAMSQIIPVTKGTYTIYFNVASICSSPNGCQIRLTGIRLTGTYFSVSYNQ